MGSSVDLLLDPKHPQNTRPATTTHRALWRVGSPKTPRPRAHQCFPYRTSPATDQINQTRGQATTADCTLQHSTYGIREIQAHRKQAQIQILEWEVNTQAIESH